MAAPTNYYVDPSAGSDGTGDGSSGNPWKTTKYAIETGITRDATNGDQVNVKDSASDTVSTAAINIGSYGTPTADAPLIVRGYTSTANDGGRATLIGNGVGVIDSASIDFIQLIDIDFSFSTIGTFLIRVDRNCFIWRCTFDANGASYCLSCNVNSIVRDCYFTGWTISGVLGASGSIYVVSCVFKEITNSISRAVWRVGSVTNCIIRINTAGANGIEELEQLAEFNSIYNGAAGTAAGISADQAAVVVNNYIEGWSGTGGNGVTQTSVEGTLVANNRFFNCTTNVGGTWMASEGNSSTSSSGLTAPGSDNFTPTSELEDIGIPTTFRTISQTSGFNVGAIQNEAAAGGGAGAGIYIPSVGRFGVSES